jgi:hypothetical protein
MVFDGLVGVPAGSANHGALINCEILTDRDRERRSYPTRRVRF